MSSPGDGVPEGSPLPLAGTLSLARVPADHLRLAMAGTVDLRVRQSPCPERCFDEPTAWNRTGGRSAILFSRPVHRQLRGNPIPDFMLRRRRNAPMKLPLPVGGEGAGFLLARIPGRSASPTGAMAGTASLMCSVPECPDVREQLFADLLILPVIKKFQ